MNKRLLLTLTMISFAFGSNPASAAEIVACAKTNSGEIRLVASAGDCKASEKALSWNAEGQQGATGPAGPQGDQGPAGSGGAGGGLDKFQYVGVSEEGVRGSSGIISLNNACHATFPGSRMCTSVEIMNTANPPDVRANLSNRIAWVRPQIIGLTNTEKQIDASGYIAKSSTTSLSCGGWGSLGAVSKSGLVLFYESNSRNGAFYEAGCGSYQATCCAAP